MGRKVELMLKRAYEHKKSRAEYHFRSIGLILFFALLLGGMILGFIIPLRPTVSDQEKRELTKLPEWEAASFVNGEFFKQLDTWYADTYPFRDQLLAGNQALKSLYGIQTEQIHGSVTGGDEIPDIMDGLETAGDSGQPDGSGSDHGNLPGTSESSADSQRQETEEAGTANDETPAAETLGEDDIPDAGGVVADELQPQVQGGVYQDGAKAYGLYYFNRSAADIYIRAVAEMAVNLEGTAQVYDMLVPDSSNIQLPEEKIQELAISDAQKATNYYYKSLETLAGDQVRTIPIYDTLLAHKDEYIYFNTDHHWTALGAYYAYTDWAAVKGVTPHSLDQFEKKEFPGFLGSYYSTLQSEELRSHPDTVEAYVPMGVNTMQFTQTDGQTLNWNIINDVSNYQAGVKYSCFVAGDNPYSIIENPAITDGSSCVVVKESFANAFIPFLVDHYETIHIIDYRYYQGSVTDFVRENQVQDVFFINSLDAIGDVDMMSRMASILPENE